MNIQIPPPPGERAALPALTSIRFLFSLGVVLFHLQLMWTWPTLQHTGLIERARLGVDMFFILSGFVLSHVYLAQFEQGRFSYRRFLVARIARIYPAHLAVIAMMVAAALLALALRQPFNAASYSFAGLAQTILLVHAWFPTEALIEWNGPSWSLSAEWGAYLLFPAFAVLGARFRRRPVALLALAVALYAVLDAGYRAAFGDTLIHAEFNMGVLRIMPAFLAGMALHLLWLRLSLPRTAAVAASLAAAALLLLLMHMRADERAIVAASGLLILALALLSKAGADGPLAWPWLVFLGEASYAIYLVHLPAITVWKNGRAALMGGDSGYTLPGWEVAVLTALILAAGALIHAVFEQPVRLWMRRRYLAAPAPAPRPEPALRAEP